MTSPNNDLLTDLADETLTGPEWEAWLEANPDAAQEILLARRVRLLMIALRNAEVELPVGFEARLMARVQADKTVLDLFDLSLGGLGRAVVELLNLLLGLLPQPQAQPAAA
ncbi:MAG: hypothetical protein MUD01_01605 [Chloroflexaceae bacterium]|jgi:hypothetical protein|nr:hypothetical protein [Chloroflexaceae bacterium]